MGFQAFEQCFRQFLDTAIKNPKNILTLSYRGRGGGRFRAPLMFFFRHPETPQAIKLKLSDFKDTSLRNILQVIPVCYVLRCYQGNKITKGTLGNLAQ